MSVLRDVRVATIDRRSDCGSAKFLEHPIPRSTEFAPHYGAIPRRTVKRSPQEFARDLESVQ